MSNPYVFSLGILIAVAASSAAIHRIATPKVDCVDEITEITNASNVAASMLLAPQSALDAVKPSLLPRTTTDKIDDVVVAAGITHGSSASFILMKILIDEDTPKSDATLQEVAGTFHKQSHQCRMSGKNYNIYVGKTLVSE